MEGSSFLDATGAAGKAQETWCGDEPWRHGSVHGLQGCYYGSIDRPGTLLESGTASSDGPAWGSGENSGSQPRVPNRIVGAPRSREPRCQGPSHVLRSDRPAPEPPVGGGYPRGCGAAAVPPRRGRAQDLAPAGGHGGRHAQGPRQQRLGPGHLGLRPAPVQRLQGSGAPPGDGHGHPLHPGLRNHRRGRGGDRPQGRGARLPGQGKPHPPRPRHRAGAAGGQRAAEAAGGRSLPAGDAREAHGHRRSRQRCHPHGGQPLPGHVLESDGRAHVRLSLPLCPGAGPVQAGLRPGLPGGSPAPVPERAAPGAGTRPREGP